MARALMAAALLVLAASPLGAQETGGADPKGFSLAAGYGFAVHLNRGPTNQHEFLIVPAFGYMLSRRWEYVAEGHVGLFRSPDGYMIGVIPLGLRFYVLTGDVRPYICSSAGLGWTDLERLPEIDRRFNFLLEGSLGVRGKISDKQEWSFEARLDHISNGGTALPNLGLNTVVFLLGWHFR
jgi:hypothetical protein